MFIDWKLFRTNLFLQSWGIGALEKNQKQQNISVATVKVAEEKKKKLFSKDKQSKQINHPQKPCKTPDYN